VQQFNVQVDTGSSDLAVPSESCVNCSAAGQRLFHTGASSTYTSLKCGSASYVCPNTQCSSGCTVDNGYGDGSGYTALASSEVFSLPVTSGSPISVSNQVFDLVTKEHGGPGQESFEPTNVDGIMGMAYRELSVLQANTPFENLVNAGILNNMFSICIPPILNTQSGGVLTIGADGGHHSDNYQYTDLYRSPKLFYSVYLQSIALAGQDPINVSPSEYNSDSFAGTIVDSGTSLIAMSDTAFNEVMAAFKSFCTSNPTVTGCSSFGTGNPLLGSCYSGITPSQWPTITFKFNQNSPYTYAVLSPEYYFYPCDSTSMTIGITNGMNSGSVILGNTFMAGFEVLFDVGGSRVGFANVSGCSFVAPPPTPTPPPSPTPTPTPTPSSASGLVISSFSLLALFLVLF